MLCIVNAVEDQIVAVHSSTDTMTFISRDQGEAIGVIDEIFAFSSQLPDE